MTALAFKAAIDDPKRFTASSKVGPYLGLTPRQYQSGESEWIGGVGKTNELVSVGRRRARKAGGLA